MNFIVLSSGSKGNTTYVECGNTKILIDVGNSCRYVTSKLESIGIDGSEIDAILVTHTHIDHVKGLKVFWQRFKPNVYVTKDMLVDLDYLEDYSLILDESFTIGDIVVEVVKTSHDAPGSVGYVINGAGKSLVYITDTGYINSKYFDLLLNREAYILESNHDVELLSNSSYPFKLRQRILGDKGHLSNYDSAKYLANFIGTRTKCVCLAHLSEENNTFELAYNTLQERLTETSKNVDKIMIAKQNEETELVKL